MVTCTNRLVLTDTVIITYFLEHVPYRAAPLRHEVLTHTHTPLCLETNNRPAVRLKMLRLLQHQSQQSTSPHQCHVYATTASHKPLRKEPLDLFPNMGQFLWCLMTFFFFLDTGRENSLMCKIRTSSRLPLV